MGFFRWLLQLFAPIGRLFRGKSEKLSETSNEPFMRMLKASGEGIKIEALESALDLYKSGARSFTTSEGIWYLRDLVISTSTEELDVFLNMYREDAASLLGFTLVDERKQDIDLANKEISNLGFPERQITPDSIENHPELAEERRQVLQHLKQCKSPYLHLEGLEL